MIPLFDRVNQTRVRNASGLSGFLSLTVGILALASVPTVSRQVRPIVFAIASLSALTANTAFRTRDQQILIIADHETLADQARQNATQNTYAIDTEQWVHNNLFNPPVPDDQPLVTQQKETELIETPGLELFDWAELADDTEYPHIAILNKTGGGKSTLAQWLAQQVGGKIYVLDPHYEPGSYTAADIVAGRGRNTGESAESYRPIYDKKGDPIGTKGEVEITHPHELASCTQMINWVHREMERRYHLRAQGISNFEAINIILDEFSSYSKKEGVPQRFKELIREARKVKIRLYILIQGSQVGDLGLEGSSDLRANLTFIRLGKFAIDYVTTKLRNTNVKSASHAHLVEVLKTLKSVKRCALIEEDIPAEVPDLS